MTITHEGKRLTGRCADLIALSRENCFEFIR